MELHRASATRPVLQQARATHQAIEPPSTIRTNLDGQKIGHARGAPSHGILRVRQGRWIVEVGPHAAPLDLLLQHTGNHHEDERDLQKCVKNHNLICRYDFTPIAYQGPKADGDTSAAGPSRKGSQQGCSQRHAADPIPLAWRATRATFSTSGARCGVCNPLLGVVVPICCLPISGSPDDDVSENL